ncbi:hypothetical protein K5549_015284 [Capra hircus]|nr:hypothetical protein K5549_015284 [Capra hircus]
MAKVTRKPRQPRRVAVRFASRMKGRKKTLWQRRYRGSVKARNMTVRVRRPLKGTLRKKNPIVHHSVEEGEENKRTKLFSPFLCT